MEKLKKLLAITLALLIAVAFTPGFAQGAYAETVPQGEGLAINETNFPDEVLRGYISEEYDKDSNNYLDSEEIEGARYLTVPSETSDLTGVKKLTDLQDLQVPGNDNIEAIDISGMTAVKTVTLYYDKHLVSVDVSGCSGLESFNAQNCLRLSSVSLDECEALEEINVFYSAISTIDLSTCSGLKQVTINNSRLYGIKVNPTENGITELQVRCNDFSEFDLSKFPDLEAFNCDQNYISSLDLSNSPDLRDLGCSNNSLTGLDVSMCPDLMYLDCSGNSISSLDVSNMEDLLSLGAAGNNMDSINLTGCHALSYLYCSNNNLTSLDISECENLEQLYCTNNSLKSLNVAGAEGLWELYCSNNPISTLNLSNNTELYYLSAASMKLKTLNLSNNKKLANLYLDGNQIKNLDLSANECVHRYSADQNNTGRIKYAYSKGTMTFDLKDVLTSSQLKEFTGNVQVVTSGKDMDNYRGVPNDCTVDGTRVTVKLSPEKYVWFIVEQSAGDDYHVINQKFYADPVLKAKPAITSAKTTARKTLTVKWTKVSNADGYQVKCVNAKTGKAVKTYSVTSGSTLSKKITGLKKGTGYKISVRAYQKVAGKTVYSGWSTAKKVTCTR